MRVFSIPMATTFRGLQRREGVLLEGPAGWAEFSPFLDYDVDECLAWLAAAIDASENPWPEPVRERVPVNCTIPAVGPERAHAMATASGCRTAKVKVGERGQSLRDDLDRVEAVRDAMGNGAVRIDANGAWDLDQALRAYRELRRFDLEYIEQPCATVEELALLRRRVDVPIAADESIRRAADPYLVRDLTAADIAVLKVQPLGGVAACLEIAQDLGLPAVVSSAVETSIGLAAGVALAAALPELPYACGLATTSLLEGDVVADPFAVVDGELGVRRPELDVGVFAEWRADEATEERWKRRFSAVREKMGE